MLLNLSEFSSESLQSQISRQIRAQILSGELAAGTSLPSIRALARSHKISVITVQRAYESLDREGLLHSSRGKGFFVSVLTAASRANMARENLSRNLRPSLASARAEGLSQEDILKTVKAVLREVVNDKE